MNFDDRYPDGIGPADMEITPTDLHSCVYKSKDRGECYYCWEMTNWVDVAGFWVCSEECDDGVWSQISND